MKVAVAAAGSSSRSSIAPRMGLHHAAHCCRCCGALHPRGHARLAHRRAPAERDAATVVRRLVIAVMLLAEPRLAERTGNMDVNARRAHSASLRALARLPPRKTGFAASLCAFLSLRLGRPAALTLPRERLPSCGACRWDASSSRPGPDGVELGRDDGSRRLLSLRSCVICLITPVCYLRIAAPFCGTASGCRPRLHRADRGAGGRRLRVVRRGLATRARLFRCKPVIQRGKTMGAIFQSLGRTITAASLSDRPACRRRSRHRTWVRVATTAGGSSPCAGCT